MNEKWELVFDQIFDEHFENSDMRVTREKLKKRAIMARPLLVDLAEEGEPGDEELATKKRKTKTYGELANEINSDAAYIGKVLGAIDFVGEQLGDQFLSPLVESSSTVGPGRGFFNWEYLGNDQKRYSTEKSSLTEPMKTTWRKYLRRTYEHDSWYKV